MHKEDRLYKLSKGSETAMWAHDEIVNQDNRIAELEKELITVSKNNIATDMLNLMEKEKVENFSIDVFKTDNGVGRDLQITCEYLDGKSVADTLTELGEENKILKEGYEKWHQQWHELNVVYGELEKERDELKGAVLIALNIFNDYEMDVEDYPTIEHIKNKEKLKQALEAHNLEQRAKGVEDALEDAKQVAGRNGYGFLMYYCTGKDLRNIVSKLRNQAKGIKA